MFIFKVDKKNVLWIVDFIDFRRISILLLLQNALINGQFAPTVWGKVFFNFKIGKTIAAFHNKNFEIKNLSLPIEYGCNQTLSKMVEITLRGGLCYFLRF